MIQEELVLKKFLTKDLICMISGQLLAPANSFLRNPGKYLFPDKKKIKNLKRIFFGLCDRNKSGMSGYLLDDPICLALFTALVLRMWRIRRKKEGG